MFRADPSHCRRTCRYQLSAAIIRESVSCERCSCTGDSRDWLFECFNRRQALSGSARAVLPARYEAGQTYRFVSLMFLSDGAVCDKNPKVDSNVAGSALLVSVT